MCPFLEESDDDDDFGASSKDAFKSGMVSNFFRNDRRYVFIGGTAVIVVFITIAGLVNSNQTPINLEELPVIQAEQAPIKVKPLSDNKVQHQDKVVYDNISGDSRQVEEKIAPQSESVLNVPEVDVSESLSVEEKQNIIQAFDELAPEKEYKINYIPKTSQTTMQNSALTPEENNTLKQLRNKSKLDKSEQKELDRLSLKITESYKSEMPEVEKSLPPIQRATKDETRKHRLKDLVSKKTAKIDLAEKAATSRKGSVMVQIASVPTKSSAESEYNRLLLKNRFLKGKGKKIFKVDLGAKKGIRYRIQVGPFKNKEEARKIISAMRDNGCAAYISQ